MFDKGNTFAVFLILISCHLRISLSFSSSVLCNRIPGLSPMQKQLCIEAPDAVAALGAGHQLGSQECQRQFKGHRWNCSDVWKRDVFGHIVSVGSREAAFTYAIASAGIVHSVTAECARGNISNCGCDQMHRYSNMYQNQAWKWGGCSVDINYGMKFSRRFLDVREIEGDERSLMNLHNNRAGRKIVKTLLQRECKCHGVSGSCTVKTCWNILPPFHMVGNAIMKKYNKAKLVNSEHTKSGLTLVIKKKTKSVSIPKKIVIPKRMELVYLQQSPNYCERDLQLGSPGTAGRFCNRTARNYDGCDLLCCGRGYNTHQINRTWQCRCKFHWCCEVKCDVCSERIEQYTCK